MKLRRTLFSVLRALPAYPWPLAAVAALFAAAGWLCSRFDWDGPALTLSAAALTLAVVSNAWWWVRHVMTPGSTKAQLARAAERAQRAGGVASRLDIAEHASARVLRAQAPVLRPSLANRRRVPTREVGVELVRLGAGLWGERVYSSCEDVTIREGGPRTGKTLSLAAHGIDAPGALITTSTRLDLAEMVQVARKDRAVHVMNPAGLGDLPSTVRWSVLTGCTDFGTASRRAADLIPVSSGEAERWDTMARQTLSLLLHAAAICGGNMRTVVRWLGDGSDKARDEVVEALSSVEVGGAMRAAEARQFWSVNDRTRTSVTATCMPALRWLADDRARDLGDAAPGTTTLDIPRLILERETLHLLGHEDRSGLAPLIGCIVAEIGHAATTLAGQSPSGRLDPPLTMLLDEAALICPVPLPQWTSDMGGRNITIHISVQSLAQLRKRWGKDGASEILGNVASLLVFGGSKAADDLTALSTLTGEHRRKVLKPAGKDGEVTERYRWTPVLSPAEIAALQPGQVMLLRRGLHVVVGRAPRVLDRRRWVREPLPVAPDWRDVDALRSPAEEGAPA